MPKHSRSRSSNAKWGPQVNTPGGTAIQIGSANGFSLKRIKTTTPGGNSEVFHQYCLDSDSCSLLSQCSSCTIKNNQADRNAREKPGSASAKQTNKDRSCDHIGEPGGTLKTQTAAALNRSRRDPIQGAFCWFERKAQSKA